MNRGDTNQLSFKLYKLNTTPKEYIDGSVYTEVEVQFNTQTQFDSLKKLKSKGEVSWETTTSNFVVNLSQEDTFKLNDGTVKMQVRLFANDICKGTTIIEIDINECLSSEVLDD